MIYEQILMIYYDSVSLHDSNFDDLAALELAQFVEEKKIQLENASK